MINSRILKTELIEWKKLKFIQQENFKDLPESAKSRLKNSIQHNQFTQPFYVWEDSTDSAIYCLDGKHRILVLQELEKEFFDVPTLLPATFIQCADKYEAAKLVLVYSSAYAKITESGFLDFMKLYDLNLEQVKLETSIPGITDIEIMGLPFPDQLTDDPKNKPAVMKITFKDANDLEQVKPAIENLLKEKLSDNYLISVSAGEI